MEPTHEYKLKVINSVSGQKDEFIPKNAHQKMVTWYMCGPTVYDQSHMGHARTYMCSDIMKRILRDFFGYDVLMAMNITDIDDKIILRSKELGEEFTSFARRFETDYFEDMKALNIELPEVITRVSEFVPQIIAYIEKIIHNGFAYESEGSVYFDTQKFKESHKYPKMEPGGTSDKDLMAEGEGALSNFAAAKKHQHDFALWKKSKEGEPSWESPWGQGRPGWHIECSAMASEIFKEYPIDVHSGGIDLRFPHHDNELAQSEAYYNCDTWIKYFWHTGHLHIDGRKMSKSLKNFVTIKEILQKYNARAIRYLFLIQKWDKVMDYSMSTSMEQAQAKDHQFNEFLQNMKAKFRDEKVAIATNVQAWDDVDFSMSDLLHKKKAAIHAALADNFNTGQALLELSELVTETNIYYPRPSAKLPLLKSIHKYVYFILKVFGIYQDGEGESSNAEQAIEPIMNALSNYRDHVKAKAKEGPKEIFKISDELRDDILPLLGIKLEDQPNSQPSIWKHYNKEELMREREDKLKATKAKEEEKQAKLQKELELKQTPAEEYFKKYLGDKYSQYDDKGIPTHDAKGEELKKKDRQWAEKQWEKQDKVHKKHLEESK